MIRAKEYILCKAWIYIRLTALVTAHIAHILQIIYDILKGRPLFRFFCAIIGVFSNVVCYYFFFFSLLMSSRLFFGNKKLWLITWIFSIYFILRNLYIWMTCVLVFVCERKRECVWLCLQIYVCAYMYVSMCMRACVYAWGHIRSIYAK